MQPDSQNGAAAAQSQCLSRDKQKDTSKPPKPPKVATKDPPKDMVYYARKLSGAAGQALAEDLEATSAMFPADQEDYSLTRPSRGY